MAKKHFHQAVHKMYAGSLPRKEFRSVLRSDSRSELQGEIRGEIRTKLQSESTCWARHSPSGIAHSDSETSSISDAPANWHSIPREFSPPSRFRVTPPEELVLPKPRARAAKAFDLSLADSYSSSDDGSLPPDSFSGPSWVSPLSASDSMSSEPPCMFASRQSSDEPEKSGIAPQSPSLVRPRAFSDFASASYEIHASEFAYGMQTSITTITALVGDEQPPSFESIGFGHDRTPRNLTCIGFESTTDCERLCPPEEGAAAAQGLLCDPSARPEFHGMRNSRSLYRPEPKRVSQARSRFHNNQRKDESLHSIATRADSKAFEMSRSRDRTGSNFRQKEKPRLLPTVPRLRKKGDAKNPVSRMFRKMSCRVVAGGE